MKWRKPSSNTLFMLSVLLFIIIQYYKYIKIYIYHFIIIIMMTLCHVIIVNELVLQTSCFTRYQMKPFRACNQHITLVCSCSHHWEWKNKSITVIFAMVSECFQPSREKMQVTMIGRVVPSLKKQTASHLNLVYVSPERFSLFSQAHSRAINVG